MPTERPADDNQDGILIDTSAVAMKGTNGWQILRLIVSVLNRIAMSGAIIGLRCAGKVCRDQARVKTNESFALLHLKVENT